MNSTVSDLMEAAELMELIIRNVAQCTNCLTCQTLALNYLKTIEEYAKTKH